MGYRYVIFVVVVIGWKWSWGGVVDFLICEFLVGIDWKSCVGVVFVEIFVGDFCIVVVGLFEFGIGWVCCLVCCWLVGGYVVVLVCIVCVGWGDV